MKKEVYINSEALVLKLNQLLSNYQVYYQNLRAFHWLIRGPEFYQLHEKFEEFYNQAAEDIDEIAERILMIGGKPLHSFEDYLGNATIKAEKDPAKASPMLQSVIQNLEVLLQGFRDILKSAANENDEGTVALMSELISGTEKKLWMLNSLKG